MSEKTIFGVLLVSILLWMASCYRPIAQIPEVYYSDCDAIIIPKLRRPQQVIDKFTYRWVLSQQISKKPFRTDGYYTHYDIENTQFQRSDGYQSPVADTNYWASIFFDDGTVVLHLRFRAWATQKDIQSRFAQTTNLNGTFSGAYRMRGDTIIAQCVSGGDFYYSFYLNEFLFLVKDSVTIQPLYSRILTPYYKSLQSDSLCIRKSTSSDMTFQAVDMLPFPHIEIKKYPWAWEYEAEWKYYNAPLNIEKESRESFFKGISSEINEINSVFLKNFFEFLVKSSPDKSIYFIKQCQ